jgi:hypothetical protein
MKKYLIITIFLSILIFAPKAKALLLDQQIFNDTNLGSHLAYRQYIRIGTTGSLGKITITNTGSNITTFFVEDNTASTTITSTSISTDSQGNTIAFFNNQELDSTHQYYFEFYPTTIFDHVNPLGTSNNAPFNNSCFTSDTQSLTDITFSNCGTTSAVYYTINDGSQINFAYPPQALSATYPLISDFLNWKINIGNITTTTPLTLVISTSLGQDTIDLSPFTDRISTGQNFSITVPKTYPLNQGATVNLPYVATAKLYKTGTSIPVNFTNTYFTIEQSATSSLPFYDTYGRGSSTYPSLFDISSGNNGSYPLVGALPNTDSLRNAFQNKAPFVYFYQIYDLVQGMDNKSSSTPFQTVTFVIPTSTATSTMVFSKSIQLPLISQAEIFTILPQSTWNIIKQLWGALIVVGMFYYIFKRWTTMWHSTPGT